MGTVPAIIRVMVLVLWLCLAFVQREPIQLGGAYLVLFVTLFFSGLAIRHFAFLFSLGLLLLAALLLIHVAVPLATSSAGDGGLARAATAWLRILLCAGALQWFLLPLVDRPDRLKTFIAALRAPQAVGILAVAPIVLLPDVSRRLSQIRDARRSQGLPSAGLRGVVAAPAMLVPLLASLIDGAIVRSEMWEHRGLLSTEATRRFAESERQSWWGGIVWGGLALAGPVAGYLIGLRPWA
jgi:hypothetical protein